MSLSTWIIGSYPSLPETVMNVTANGVTQAVTIPAGSYYVDDPSSSLSLCKQLELALESHSQIATVTVAVCQDRKVRITSNVAFSATFIDSTARTVLGFTSLSSSAASHTAPLISSYLWSPRRRESSSAPLGTQGRRAYDTAVGASAAGRVVATTNNWYRLNEFTWHHVALDRVWTKAEAAGEYQHFFHTVLRNFHKIKLYRDVEDDPTSIAAVTFPSGSQLGPYVMKAEHNVGWAYVREIRQVEKRSRVELDVHGTPEYD